VNGKRYCGPADELVAGISGVRHLRRMITQRSFRDVRVVQIHRGDYDYDAR
jgi:hypothetical protein